MNSDSQETYTFEEPPEEFVMKNENDVDRFVIPDKVINRIKIEPSEDNWDECYLDRKETVDRKVENESLVNTDNQGFQTEPIEQLFIKDENYENIGAISEFQFCETFKMEVDSGVSSVTGICEELIIKNESDTDRWDSSTQKVDKQTSANLEPPSNHKVHTCIECNATFRRKRTLDDHIFKKHPNSNILVTRKVYECPRCIFKTTLKNNFDRHMSVHPETVSSHKLSMCIHCDAIVKSKRALDDHVVRKHPDLAKSVARKVYECTECIFKTVQKSDLDRHMSIHPESVLNSKLSTCTLCNATFKSKISLDAHVVRKHSTFIATVK